MLILTCILIRKYRGKKYKGLSIGLVIVILLLLIFLIRKVCIYIQDRKNVAESEEWVDIQSFSNVLEMNKIGKIQSYPEVTLLSDIDGEILGLNVDIGDIVEEYQILMQIENVDPINSDYDEAVDMVETMYKNYDKLEKEYNEFQSQYGEKIKQLENQLINDQTALIMAMELKDIEGKKMLEDEIETISEEYKTLKSQQSDMKNRLNNLDSEAKFILNESDKYYYEMEKQTPRAPFDGVIGDIYVNEGESVNNGDKLITIINNNFTPEISVSLDFDEYLLTKDLTGVYITIENENRGDLYYEGEIYSRSPILNDEGQYTITVKILDENIPDLILNDDNSKITVIFTIDSTSEWIPTRCFKKIGKDKGELTLRDGDVITGKQVGIKSQWENWINIDNLGLFGLEKEEEKDGIDLCVEDWNNELYKDESVAQWRNQFETVESFCAEFIKENPMYWTGHRNLAIVSELGGSGELIEVLCDVE